MRFCWGVFNGSFRDSLFDCLTRILVFIGHTIAIPQIIWWIPLFSRLLTLFEVPRQLCISGIIMYSIMASLVGLSHRQRFVSYELMDRDSSMLYNSNNGPFPSPLHCPANDDLVSLRSLLKSSPVVNNSCRIDSFVIVKRLSRCCWKLMSLETGHHKGTHLPKKHTLHNEKRNPTNTNLLNK